MTDKYIQVNELWLRSLIRFAEQAERSIDMPYEKFTNNILIGHALSAKRILKYGKKIDPIVDEWGKDI